MKKSKGVTFKCRECGKQARVSSIRPAGLCFTCEAMHGACKAAAGAIQAVYGVEVEFYIKK